MEILINNLIHLLGKERFRDAGLKIEAILEKKKLGKSYEKYSRNKFSLFHIRKVRSNH
jgi:hypothetical protein